MCLVSREAQRAPDALGLFSFFGGDEPASQPLLKKRLGRVGVLHQLPCSRLSGVSLCTMPRCAPDPLCSWGVLLLLFCCFVPPRDNTVLRAFLCWMRVTVERS